MENADKKTVFDKTEKLVQYIRYLYAKQNNNQEITPIKLQKSLYFLFAIWGGMVVKSRNNEKYVDFDLSKYSKYLFKDQFEAWVYGPVIPSVYKNHKDSKTVTKEYDEGIFKGDQFLKETISAILSDIFEIADFKLVSISHEDECWKNRFDINDIIHETIIPKDDIINEYAKRESVS